MIPLVKIVAISGCVLLLALLPDALLQQNEMDNSAAEPDWAMREDDNTGRQDSTEPEVTYVSDWHEVGQGSLVFRPENMTGYALSPAVDTAVELSVTGLIARAKVVQTFVNPSEEWINARYVFPLPEDAAVDHLQMKVGNRTIEGQIKAKTVAKKIFNQAKASGKKASLVEQHRPNIFSNQIANIAPKERVVITIEYQQAVFLDNDIFSLRFPMTVAPRYIPGTPSKVDVIDNQGWAFNTNEVSDAASITPPVKSDEARPNNVKLIVDLQPGFEATHIDSEFHSITTNQLTPKHVRLALSGEEIANRDFVLTWKPSALRAPEAAVFSQTFAGKHYSMIMMMPPSSDAEPSQRIKRDLTFILDTSGSMAGDSIVQAKQALKYAIENLHEQDSFNLIEFNSQARKLWPVSRLANDRAKKQAGSFVDALEAGGGTEMLSALQLALGDQKPNWTQEENRIRQVVFLTDGSVGNEYSLMQFIESHLLDSRLFTIGIGSAPNSYFMSEAASVGRGTFTYIGATDQVKSKMQDLFSKLERPAMTDLTLSMSEEAEVFPNRLPDLYSGQPLVFALRSERPLDKIIVSGQSGNGIWRQQLAAASGRKESGINVHWARQKIKQLEQEKRRSDEPDRFDQKILSTALTHHLVSSMTSLVAVDVTPADLRRKSVDRHVPSHLPAGWQAEKVFGHLPQTATPALLHILIGLVLLGLAFISSRVRFA